MPAEEGSGVLGLEEEEGLGAAEVGEPAGGAELWLWSWFLFLPPLG